jgi:hypothetical protein
MEVLRLLEAYEWASCVGLPEVEIHTNKERVARVLQNISSHLGKDNDLSNFTEQYVSVLSIFNKNEKQK